MLKYQRPTCSIGAGIFTTVLAVLFVALRFYTRVFTRSGLGADDWLILTGLLTGLLSGGLVVWANAVTSSQASSIYPHTPSGILFQKIIFVTSILFFTISGATKLGIVFMYYRFFAPRRTFRFLIFISFGLVIAWWVGCTVADITICIPLIRSWTNGPRPRDRAYGINYNVFWMASGICEIFLDVLILVLPITMVVRMHLSLGQKLSISGIFLLGGLIIITGILRVSLSYMPGNPVFFYFKTQMWTSVHAGMSLACSNLPIFKPLINHISESRFINWVSSILPLRRNWKNLRSSPDGTSFGRNHINDRTRTLPLTTIRETPQREIGFYQTGVTYSGDDVASSTTQQPPSLETRGDDYDRELLQQIPDDDTSRYMKLPIQHV
ncbi:hypothetical protein F4805DRAFT_173056 [Annulohypoxylon moriforme]|nr:hypothetical protein F4805DRAFT_173056 [Annulohypoxylon moriforme]